MKKHLLSTLIAMVAMTATAQKEVGTATIYPKIGVNFSTISNDVVLFDDGGTAQALGTDFKVGFTIGAEYQHQLYKGFAASAGLFYSMQGTSYDVSKLDANEYDLGGMKQTLHYINIPIMAVLYVARNLSLKAGVQGGYLLGARMDGTDNVATFKRFDFSIPIGVAYEYKSLIVDLRYCHGISKLCKYTNEGDGNRNITVTVGYGFDI